jgi:uncharacterized membrane protein
MKGYWRLIILFLVGASLFTRTQPIQAQTPIPDVTVYAVFFYSPICGHCHYVVSEVLPPLFEQYGDHLLIVGVDITQPSGAVLFQAAMQYFNLETSGVPFLVIGDTYLVGSLDIPQKFPGLIKTYMAKGGVGLPLIPGLAEALATAQPTESPTNMPKTTPIIVPTTTVVSPTLPTPTLLAASTLTPTPGLLLTGEQTSGIGSNFAHDPLGNSLAVVILVGMIFSVGGIVIFFRHIPGASLSNPWGWAIPILCTIGFGIASYLAYVEMTQVTAVCGPVGDCNTVQQSEYARLFGLLPIGLLGLVGYVVISLAWIVGRFGKGNLAELASLALLGMTAFGTLFSIYLTFLEPFVIGATCAWCLTSALIMTVLLWLSVAPASLAISRLFQGGEHALNQPDARGALESR